MPRTHSGEPIRRDSREKGTFERGWFRPLTYGEAHRLQVAAERHDRRTREKGRHGGACGGRTGLHLLAFFARLSRLKPDGQIDPSYVYMRAALGMSIDAIARALKRLESVGLIEKARRVERADDEGPRSNAWRQASNAYRLLMPAWLAAALPLVMQDPPRAPDDHEHAAAVGTATNAAQVRELPSRDWARVEFDDPRLAAAMAKFRESAAPTWRSSDSGSRNESLPGSPIGVARSGDRSLPRIAACSGDRAAGMEGPGPKSGQDPPPERA